MSYRVQQHSYIRGRDATVFTMRSPGGDVVTISAPADKGKGRYVSTTSATGYPVPRSYIADVVRSFRRQGWEVNAVRYVYIAPREVPTCFDCGRTLADHLDRVPFGDIARSPVGYYCSACYEQH